MAKARVAINGFGRIGRTFFRLAYGNPDFEIVAINDLGDAKNLAYLLMYDSSYGRSPFDASIEGGALKVDGRSIRFTGEKELAALPWKDEHIDIVVESTGVFTMYEKAKGHLDAGAKRVVISAPSKNDPARSGVKGATVLMGVNEEQFADARITSNASCTTNAASPLIAILKSTVGIEKALLNTVHAYTASQSLVDGLNKKDFREGRSAAQNIIPSSTGAALATTLAHTELKGKFDGISLRVPVAVGSIVDITFLASKKTTVEEVNGILKDAAGSRAWQKLFAVTEDPIVSSDIIGAQYAAIADLSFTRVVDGDLVKVLAWYDNETGYSATLVSHVAEIAKILGKT